MKKTVNKKIKTKKKNKLQKEISFLFPVLVIIFISIVTSGISAYYFSYKFSGKKLTENQKIQDQLDLNKQTNIEINNESIRKEDQAVIEVVKKNSPAVVSIIVTKDIPQIDSFFNDPFFNQFYLEQRHGSETETREIGGGTGFIVDSSGYIITNKHVVEDQNADYTVILSDGESYTAEILARDTFLDIAILKIEKEGLPVTKMGNSDNLNIGQTVIAIGNSLGEFDNTVSKGIISGLKRQVEAGDSLGQTEILDEVIQTDAAINPGNSGGPLFDLNGLVIGVNVAMAQGAENIGFTIPVNQIKDIYESVKKTGRIIRPYLGVRYVLIDEKIQKANNLLVDHGALILRGSRRSEMAVIPGSPANKAGLEEYDIILEIDNQKIDQTNTLTKIMRKKKVGQEISLKVLSKGSEKNIKAILEESDF